VADNVLKDWLVWTRVADLGDLAAARGLEMYPVRAAAGRPA
jgi:hypothetical protein